MNQPCFALICDSHLAHGISIVLYDTVCAMYESSLKRKGPQMHQLTVVITISTDLQACHASLFRAFPKCTVPEQGKKEEVTAQLKILATNWFELTLC